MSSGLCGVVCGEDVIVWLWSLALVVRGAFTTHATKREVSVFWDGCENVEVMSTAAGEERRA